MQRSGERVHTDRFVLILASGPVPDGPARLGITASRKIGNAVARNRAKRLVRVAFRELSALFARGCDLVVIVRRPLGELKLAEVLAEWRGAAPQLERRQRGLLARAVEAANTRA